MKEANRDGKKQQVLVIGGGIAGAATAWALSAHGGYECTVLERESQLAIHSTAKNASILRTFTGDWASSALALETAEFLAAPPAGFAPHKLLDPVGLILITTAAHGQTYERWAARKAPNALLRLSPAELSERYPHWNGHAQDALLVRDEGRIDVSGLLDALVRDAKRNGASFVLGAQVESLLKSNGQVCGVCMTGGQTIDADLVVIAAGGWAGKLGRAAGSELYMEPRRRHLLVTAHDPAIDRQGPILWSEPDAFYMRPESGGWMLCACDQDVVDPNHCAERPEVLELIAARTGQCLPEFADAPVQAFWAGMRTFTKDDQFAIGFDAHVPGLFWAAGLGGHGISTSIGVGRLCANLIAGESVDNEVARAMNPARFTRVARSV
ncbi:MAG: D-arginine dehydrogenase [Candidatus Paceibacteria bacterium]|jgi:D-arginine dehydrogenase